MTASKDSDGGRVLLDARDISALRFARELVRGVERNYADDPSVGTREGEATSDVLSAIIARAESAALPGSANA